ncbi:fibronectin type III domain-containing protein [Marinobacter sp.]|uniref:fibronectin type III domain-containing protein n=1 Tax=Marinobacter sp. TaxID=50741 RepID=UPI00384BD3A1
MKISKSGVGALLIAGMLAGCGDSSGGSDSGSTTATGNGGEVETSASLKWNPPLKRVNNEGLAMGELQSYVILYGQDPDALDLRIEVTDASELNEPHYMVSDLSEGTWYFAIQVIDTQGLVSAPSEVVSKVI